jgi:GTP pyrophosphokinase
VIDRSGQRIEVQIRSEIMDAIAERGIVAHWEGGSVGSRKSRSLRWLGQLMDWQHDVSDPHEFIEAVKADLFADEVYVFSPEGDIFTFPKGATPIDFAFAIHTDVGMTCSGARVNGHLVPLRYRLRQGDTVEILTNPSVGPREEWLKMCVSSRARARIKHHLRQRERARLRSLGRSLVEQEVASRGWALPTFEGSGELAAIGESVGLSKDAGLDGVYESVGAGQVTADAIASRLGSTPAPRSEEKGLFTRVLRRMTRGGRRTDEGLGAEAGSPIVLTEELVEGGQGRDATVTLAPCCSPVPGDPLIGFFEPGRGIVAHVQGCPEALEHLSERKVHLAWAEGLSLDRPVTLEVRTANTVGLLAEMSRAFSHHGVNIKQANCRAYGDGDRAINTFQASVSTLPQLQSLVTTLKGIEGVVGVERVFTRGSGVYP